MERQRAMAEFNAEIETTPVFQVRRTGMSACVVRFRSMQTGPPPHTSEWAGRLT